MGNLIYGGLTAALIVGTSTGAYYLIDRPGAERVGTLDTELCRTDHAHVAHRIILLDTTDLLSPDERMLTREVVDGEAAAAQPYERVTIYAINGADPYSPVELFTACAPKRASDAEGISENPRLYEAIWKHRFRAPLDVAINAQIVKNGEDRSPIIETIWAISRLHDFGSGVKQRRLVIESDLLQNMPEFSQYRGVESFATFRHSSFGQLNLPDLTGVEVVIHYLERPKTLALQTERHIRFWTDFFKAAGAASVIVEGGPHING